MVSANSSTQVTKKPPARISGKARNLSHFKG